jgi:hypothetical protein
VVFTFMFPDQKILCTFHVDRLNIRMNVSTARSVLNAYLYMYMCVYMGISVYVCMVCTYVCMYVCMHICIMYECARLNPFNEAHALCLKQVNSALKLQAP